MIHRPPLRRLIRPRGWVRPGFASWAHVACTCCEYEYLFVACSAGTSGLIYKLRASDGSIIWTYDPGGRPAATDVAGSPGGRMSEDDSFLYVPVIRNAGWTGSGGANASVIILNKSDGSVALAVDTGADNYAVAVRSDGYFVVVGKTLPKLYNSAGTLIWTAGAGMVNLARDLVFDHNGDVMISRGSAASGDPNLYKLSGADGTVSASIHLNTGETCDVGQIDTDQAGTVYAGTADANSKNLFAVGNTLAAVTWSQSLSVLGAVNSVRSYNTVGLECMAGSFIQNNGQRVSRNDGTRLYNFGGLGVVQAVSMSRETNITYAGFSPAGTSWEGSGGVKANLLRLNEATGDYVADWGVRLQNMGANESVNAISARKQWNT